MTKPKTDKPLVIHSAEDLALAKILHPRRKGITVNSKTVGPIMKSAIKKLKKRPQY